MMYLGPRHEHSPNSYSAWYGRDSEEQAKLFYSSYNASAVKSSHRLDGTWGYNFNSLGFRGDELNPNCHELILVAGCSNTFGTGVKWEQTWGYIFRNLLLDQEKSRSYNLLNVAQGAAPNDYISRTVISSCKDLSPTLVLVLFTHSTRKEHVTENSIDHIAPCREDELADSFYCYFTKEDGFINSLKNMILVQEYCRARKIALLMGWVDHYLLTLPELHDNPICQNLIQHIEQRTFFPFSIRDNEFMCDHARDNMHPGPQSHERFARAVYEFYQNTRALPD